MGTKILPVVRVPVNRESTATRKPHVGTEKEEGRSDNRMETAMGKEKKCLLIRSLDPERTAGWEETLLAGQRES